MNSVNDMNNIVQDVEVEDSVQATQSTQQASQVPYPNFDHHLWGYLQPCSAALFRIDFLKVNTKYAIGRHENLNNIILPGMKISNQHCVIMWDGSEGSASVIVTDLSSNGTFINNARIGKGQSRALRDGNEIAFGTCVPQPQNGGLEDYRFIYRHMARGPPTSGFYASYDITQELGKGSFAVVMKAVCRATGKLYAVKMIQESRHVRHPGENQNQNSRRCLFEREISILENLDHPNICKLKEVFYEESGDINLVLELVEGGDLLDYILQRNGLVEEDARHITYQLCLALAHIHSKNVTHRDLKPENVLLTKDVPPMVKIADFGLAKAVDSQTMLRTMCGTPSYLAPEVVKQDQSEGYDSLVDSWSVGVIVFSMLTNSSPFIESESQKDVCTRIIARSIDWNYLKGSKVSSAAEDFIRSLLEENPKQRMTMKGALSHSWLAKHMLFLNSSSLNNDRSSMSDGLQNLHIMGSASALAIVGPMGNGIGREGSRTAPLQRRSVLLSQAQEDGESIPEPSQEMVKHVTAQDARATASISKSERKRVYSELTPLSEEEETTAVDSCNNSSTLQSELDVPYRKSTDEESWGNINVKNPTVPSPRKNSRGRANKTGETKADAPAVPPRRSGRVHAQKFARLS